MRRAFPIFSPPAPKPTILSSARVVFLCKKVSFYVVKHIEKYCCRGAYCASISYGNVSSRRWKTRWKTSSSLSHDLGHHCCIFAHRNHTTPYTLHTKQAQMSSFPVKMSSFSVFGVNDFSTGNGQFTAFLPPNFPPLQVKIDIKTTEY